MKEDQAGQTGHIVCPKCGSSDVRRSKSEGFLAALQQMLGRLPFRCRSCRIRFYRVAPHAPEEED